MFPAVPASYHDRRMSWLAVDRAAITANARMLGAWLPAGTVLGVAVKADGYGHGVVETARAAARGGASWLCVATVREGVELRAAGLTLPILVLGAIAADEAADLVAYRLTPHLCDHDTACAVVRAAAASTTPYPVHIKVDTGMHRYGVPADTAAEFVAALHANPALFVEGISTHFATADVPDDPLMHRQAARFAAVIATLERHGIRPPLVHAANSGAMLQRVALWEMVRVGIALYGVPPDKLFPMSLPLRPAMSVHSRIARIIAVDAGESVGYGATYHAGESHRAALVPLGYADGLPRALSNKGALLVRGRRCPIIGRISMDQCVIALPYDLDTHIGDEVVIVGQSGSIVQTMSDLASDADTVAYELLVRFGGRLRRVYND